MHILVTADTLGGVWTYARELVTGLARRGIRVTLVSFGEILPPERTAWIEELRGVDYRPTAFKLEWMQDSEADMEASAEYLSGLVEETRPDLLHLNQYYYGALPCDVPRIVVAHSDVVSWWWAVHRVKPVESAWLRWYREAVTRGLSRADAVLAPSRWMLDQIQLHYTRAARSHVVPNGRSVGRFNPHVTKEDFIVTLGRLWDSGKNAALLLRDDMPLPVHIIGAERHPELGNPAFFMEEIRPNIHLEPQQDERQIAALLSRAAIYAATSQYEPFGLAPLEAALSRCAIVASDIPSFRELWEGAALFFNSHDSRDLRSKLELLAQDPGLRRRYGNLAYDHARRRFTAVRMVDQYVDLYHSLVPTPVNA
jgi:glycosyltransferase involved in cell wall biosynthesis